MRTHSTQDVVWIFNRIDPDYVHRALDDAPVVTPADSPAGPIFAAAYEDLCATIGIRLAATCPDFENLVLRYNTVHMLYSCIQRMPVTISVLYLLLDWQPLPLDHFSSCLHFVSTCRGSDLPFRWTVWVIGTVLRICKVQAKCSTAGRLQFHNYCIPENVDIMNSNPSAGILNGYFPSIEPKQDTLISWDCPFKVCIG